MAGAHFQTYATITNAEYLTGPLFALIVESDIPRVGQVKHRIDADAHIICQIRDNDSPTSHDVLLHTARFYPAALKELAPSRRSKKLKDSLGELGYMVNQQKIEVKEFCSYN